MFTRGYYYHLVEVLQSLWKRLEFVNWDDDINYIWLFRTVSEKNHPYLPVTRFQWYPQPSYPYKNIPTSSPSLPVTTNQSWQLGGPLFWTPEAPSTSLKKCKTSPWLIFCQIRGKSWENHRKITDKSSENLGQFLLDRISDLEAIWIHVFRWNFEPFAPWRDPIESQKLIYRSINASIATMWGPNDS